MSSCRDMSPFAAAARLGVAALIAVALGAAAADARVSAGAGAVRRPAVPPGGTGVQPAPSRAPSAPPLIPPGAGASGGAATAEPAAGAPPAEADPLVSNGLGSPLCKGALGGAELSAASRRDCEASGFVAAVAPTGNYGIDVHIDTPLLGIGASQGLTIVQDLFVTPLWMAIVWAVHTLLVMLEWCFTIDLLDSASAGVGGGLRRMQAAITEPWLASVLAVASVIALYNGLIRRRVAETVGQALLVLSMMAGGMWVMLDPTGTVGALGGWANQASIGTLSVSSTGSSGQAPRALADSMRTVFSAAIEAPWCYLEFGNVDWCRDPGRRDPRLRQAGLRIAAEELALVGCNATAGSFSPCVRPASAEAKALERSAELLRGAPSNGAVFLALPANGPARNSINESGSLLHALCQGSDATSCSGPTAAEAQFRTNRGTWPRVGGLLLIVGGVLGMLLLLGFIALRLLAAAIFSLLYLLLAPVAVLAPALGEGGRAVFRRWAGHLLGAVVSKLIYSFLLGVVLAVLGVLAQLQGLGWWTQWLLMSAFWWGAYARRHEAFAIPGAAQGRVHVRGPRSIAQRARAALETSGSVLGMADRAVERRMGPRRRLRDSPRRSPFGDQQPRVPGDRQAEQTLESDHGEARALLAAGLERRARWTSLEGQLARVREARASAAASGDQRGRARLAVRESRIDGALASEREALGAARHVIDPGGPEPRHALPGHAAGALHERARFLDDQAALPARGRAAADGGRRDYPALAGLAGYGRAQYEQLEPRRRRSVRLQIDRELALRRELGGAARRPGAGAGTGAEAGVNPAMPAGDPVTPPPRRKEQREDGSDRPPSRRDPPPGRSSVLDDAREVAARRKRQLGRDRP